MIEAEIFRALADPTRRAVFERLAAGEMSVSELRTGMTVSQPAVSQHLAVLRGAGLVVERRAGRNAFTAPTRRGSPPCSPGSNATGPSGRNASKG